MPLSEDSLHLPLTEEHPNRVSPRALPPQSPAADSEAGARTE